MENKEIKENMKIEELAENWQKLAKDQAIISAAIQYKKSQEIIREKVENENSAILFGIKSINKKVLENPQKYLDVENEYKSLLERYEKDLNEIGEYHDTQIVMEYMKVLDEEIKQCKMSKDIYYLIQEEKIAKKKVDNSDDEIREKICNIEDAISKSELKIRRTKPTIRKKIQDKNEQLYSALESKQKEVQKETIKGPRIFDKATKFFLGKFSPYKIIQKNVFQNLNERIDDYEKDENRKKVKKANEKFREENILETLNEVTSFKEITNEE